MYNVVEVCGHGNPKTIRLYSVATGNAVQAYEGPEVPWKRVCVGPEDSLLTCSSEGEVAQFKWIPGQKRMQLSLECKVKFAGIENVYGMCHVPTQHNVILTSPFSVYRLMLDHPPLNPIWKGKVVLVY